MLHRARHAQLLRRLTWTSPKPQPAAPRLIFFYYRNEVEKNLVNSVGTLEFDGVLESRAGFWFNFVLIRVFGEGRVFCEER
jgi:hypothetical protein